MDSTRTMVIDEHDEGERYVRTHLSPGAEDSFRLRVDHAFDVELDIAVLDRVMARYGKPLDEGVTVRGPSLSLAGGRSLTLLRHRARYDVIARDFLVFSREGEWPLCELATSIAAALCHLARRSLHE